MRVWLSATALLGCVFLVVKAFEYLALLLLGRQATVLLPWCAPEFWHASRFS